MAAAKIKFAQGSVQGADDEALIGVLGTEVTAQAVEAMDDYKWTVVDVPPGSAVPTGIVAQGSTAASYSFEPDERGGYHLELEGLSGGRRTKSRKVFQVQEEGGWVIPPFDALARALNFGGQLRGWAKYIEDILRYLLAILRGGNYRDVLTTDTQQIGAQLDVVSDGTHLWTLSDDGKVRRVDPSGGTVLATIEVAGAIASGSYGYARIYYDGSRIYVAANQFAYAIDRGTNEVVGIGDSEAGAAIANGLTVIGDSVYASFDGGESACVSLFSRDAMLAAFPGIAAATTFRSAGSFGLTNLVDVFSGEGRLFVAGFEQGIDRHLIRASLSTLATEDSYSEADADDLTRRGIVAFGGAWLLAGNDILKFDPVDLASGPTEIQGVGATIQRAIVSDGTYLWSSGDDAAPSPNVFKVDPVTPALITNVEAPDADEAHVGLAVYGTFLWGACTPGLRKFQLSPPVIGALFEGPKQVIWDKPPVEHATTNYLNYNLQRAVFGTSVNTAKKGQVSLGSPGSGIGASSYTDGDYASVLGGKNGKATADGATVLGGLDCEAQGTGSSAFGGEGTRARLGGMTAFQSFASGTGAPDVILAQECTWKGGGYSDNNAPGAVLNRDGLPPLLEDGKTYGMLIVVTAVRLDAPGGGVRRCQATFTCAGGAASQVGTTETIGTSTLPAGVSFAFDAPSGLTIPMLFDGVAAQTWQASVCITWCEAVGTA